MRSERRVCRWLVLALVALVSSLGAAPFAASADSKGTEIAGGWTILGAEVTGPNLSAPRHLDDAQAAAFVQAWLPASIYGQLTPEDPPPDLDVYTVEVTDTVQGTPQRLVAYYASNGQSAWVSMPPQDLGGGAFVSKQTWLIAPPRTIAAFEGKLAPEPIAGASSTTAARRAASPRAANDESSSSTLALVGGAVVVLALVGAVVIWRRRRAVR